ncbi:helix-turn-helix transcriptional regulator [Streptomyces sp. NPDC060002]|uniref:helix-turn-helix domain-containing protein n=1 Tax=Streptomyces sp. NPDC060002 TaxID=3347033 RepID=UPI0036B8D36F
MHHPQASLSAREREVAALAVADVPSREIGGQLLLSTRTVDNHLQRVYTKLGITSRQDLANVIAPPPRPGPRPGRLGTFRPGDRRVELVEECPAFRVVTDSDVA